MTPTERHYEKKMESFVKKAFKIAFMIIFGILLIFLMGFVVMWLWNWLMPDIFGLPTLSYWQAFGLLALAKIIFGFGHHSSKGSGHKSKKRHKGDRFCRPKKEFSKWRHYDQFWQEEGENAYNAYLERIQKEKSDESTQEN